LNLQAKKLFITPTVKYSCETWQFSVRDKRKMKLLEKKPEIFKNDSKINPFPSTGALGAPFVFLPVPGRWRNRCAVVS
jgi:hypothetical protein